MSDTTSDASSEMTTVMANGRKNEPDWPPTNPIGANTATVVKVELVMAPATSLTDRTSVPMPVSPRP